VPAASRALGNGFKHGPVMGEMVADASAKIPPTEMGLAHLLGITQAEREFNMAAFLLRPLWKPISRCCARSHGQVGSNAGYGTVRERLPGGVSGKPPPKNAVRTGTIRQGLGGWYRGLWRAFSRLANRAS
jgi:hypothetical protein